MDYPKSQIEELKRYCSKLSTFSEASVVFFQLEGLHLPPGCKPDICTGLLCPAERDGYPSRLYFSEQVISPYTRNWNVSNARIGEKNWFAFSWKIDLPNPTLTQMLVAHLGGFVSA